jgi:hypothetical protein
LFESILNEESAARILSSMTSEANALADPASQIIIDTDHLDAAAKAKSCRLDHAEMMEGSLDRRAPRRGTWVHPGWMIEAIGCRALAQAAIRLDMRNP